GAPSDPSAPVTPTAAVPGAPTAVIATRNGNQSLNVSFTAPSANGAAITGYTVTSRSGGITATGTASPITVTGLENGTAYSFRVTATNGIGTGHASKASNKIRPSTVPGKPTNVKVVRGNGQATVSFAAPVDVGGVPGNGGSPITSYAVSLNEVISFTKAASPITVTGLENGSEYTFKVWANNENGKGAEAKSNPVTPATLPGAPVINGTEDGNTQVTVLFTAPTIDGGNPITKYTVTSSPGGKTATAASSPITVTGLTNGTAYTFTVKATNDVGTGFASAPSGKAIPGHLAGPSAMIPAARR
ncbi:MAG: fibronectin type III domain-containing protein, partial [Lentisphaerota bacterium]